MRAPSSARVSRPSRRSTAGGTEIRDAVARKIVMPIPTSTSVKRRSASSGPSGSSRSRATRRELKKPSASMLAAITPFTPTITP